MNTAVGPVTPAGHDTANRHRDHAGGRAGHRNVDRRRERERCRRHGVGGVPRQRREPRHSGYDGALYGLLEHRRARQRDLHSVTAVARDTSGNQTTSAPVSVTINNPTDTASIGAWSAPFELGFVAVNMVLLNTGKVLMYPGWEPSGTAATVFNPATGTLTSTPNHDEQHLLLRAFDAGGRPRARRRRLGWRQRLLGCSTRTSSIPRPSSGRRLPNMSFRRWYPSATTLADGRVLVTSGATTCETCIAEVPEIFNPVTNTFTQLTGAQLKIPYYPFAFVLPNGKVLDTGSTDTATPARTLDVATQTWTVRRSDGVRRIERGDVPARQGASVGHGVRPAFVVKPSATTTSVLDMTQASPAWRPTAPMAYPRAYNNLTILPDGSVLALGGGNDTSGSDLTTAVFASSCWSPSPRSGRRWRARRSGRLYHSTRHSAAGRPRAGRWRRDYLRRSQPDAGGVSLAAVPVQGRAPDTHERAGRRRLRHVVLRRNAATARASRRWRSIRPGAATHAFDENQRFVPLTFSQTTGGLTVQAPANANLAPPGHYMLFIVNTAGVPSVAPFVRFPAPYEDAIPPSAPANLTATGSIGAAALTWTASTDNLGVVGYDVHRSTVAGFTPNVGNRIAQPAGTSYNDTPPAAGTYYYLVLARDLAGNLSAPSNQATATVTSDTTAPTVSLTSPAAAPRCRGRSR